MDNSDEILNMPQEEYEKIFGTISPRVKELINTYRPMTNADHIRSLSDEELATFLAHLTDCVWCPCPDPHDQCDTVDGGCKKQWLDWLKEEAKGEA